jgi:hypothetical protein
VRIVQDRGIDATEPLPREEDGTKVLANLFDATADSLFPLQGALGYEIHQTLFIGPNTLVVEGPADLLYLRAVSAELEREGRIGLSEKWVITPVGGSGKAPAFVALLAPQKGMTVATLLDVQAGDRPQIEEMYKKKLLAEKHVVTYAEFTGTNEADVEDMFDRDFYVELVNAEYARQLAVPIDPKSLDARIPRTLRALEDYLKANPLKSGAFGHYRPARYFAEHAGRLWATISDPLQETLRGGFQSAMPLAGTSRSGHRGGHRAPKRLSH